MDLITWPRASSSAFYVESPPPGLVFRITSGFLRSVSFRKFASRHFSSGSINLSREFPLRDNQCFLPSSRVAGPCFARRASWLVSPTLCTIVLSVYSRNINLITRTEAFLTRFFKKTFSRSSFTLFRSVQYHPPPRIWNYLLLQTCVRTRQTRNSAVRCLFRFH